MSDTQEAPASEAGGVCANDVKPVSPATEIARAMGRAGYSWPEELRVREFPAESTSLTHRRPAP